MVTAEISVVPIGTKTSSVSKYVAKAIKLLSKQNKVKYQLTSMGTIVYGELDDVFKAVRKMHLCLFDEEIKRVVTTIRIDDRRDKNMTADSKVISVLKKLG